MKITVVAMDTRGGIQPYVALSLGLKAAGHEVRAVAPSDLAAMFSDAGIAVTVLSGSIEAVVRGSGGATERGAFASILLAARELPPRIVAWTKEALAGCEGSDVITGGIGGMVVALAVAEKLGVPFIEAHLQPVGVHAETFPGVLVPAMPSWLGSVGRSVSHQLTDLMLWGPFKGPMMTARSKVLGLSGPPRMNTDQPVLYGFSRHVIEMPSQGDRARHVTGYWTLKTAPDWSPPPALEAFLAREGPVVSIGFGSMANQDPDAVTEMVLGAVRDAGVRAVLLSGWGGLKALPEAREVFCADALPHDWLFPKMRAVVHHGGAGTTGAGLRAGVPSIVVPFTMDQPFWASRVHALGVGPKPIPRPKLTRASLAVALRSAVADDAMSERARALGEKVRAEDGVANAVARFGELRR